MGSDANYDIPSSPLFLLRRSAARHPTREPTFASEQDLAFYLNCLRRASQEHALLIDAYVLMSNHMHLLVHAEDYLLTCMRYVELNPLASCSIRPTILGRVIASMRRVRTTD